ncbi:MULTISPECIES: BREX-2 system phosphatase PglZ [unclassified Streptomyces]|uniref:BREX-2 system phosphatase PglZ n=1 Tax=unclassified Streptomyces TaxID=2593676 RepID=UPI00093F24AA|nr:BREX-2 system phosphatase PglZ [Streptomyces sp. TSRI0281]OKI34408.1 phage resistance protein [Streptomyces sp. TSRI0281]
MSTATSATASTAAATSAVRLNRATVKQYLASQSGLQSSKRRVVLLRAEPVWHGPSELSWGEPWRAVVRSAPSPLAVHELILAHQNASATGPEVLVVLTDREEAELGPDLLAKVHKQRVNAVNTWDVVREAFGAVDTDSRLYKENWAAESLLDATPPGGWPQLAGGILTWSESLTALALRRLGIGRYDPDRDPRASAEEFATPSGGGADTGSGALVTGTVPNGDGLDVHALLRWSMSPGGPERLLSLRPAERNGLTRFLGEEDQTGLAGQALLALVGAEHGSDAVAFGLVCAALWGHADATADAEDYRARGRAERWFGEEPPARDRALDALAAAFGRSCESFVSGLLLAGRTGRDEAAAAARRLSGAALDRAGSLVRQFGAERAARTSPVLTEGLESRFGDVGRALASGDAGTTAQAVRALDEHGQATDPDARTRISRAKMAQRLMQWLAAEPGEECETVASGVRRHIAETGWVDLALEHIEAGGDPDASLRSAYDTLCTSVRATRRAIDRHFAKALATWTANGTDPGAMLTVETFLPIVVAPVVKAGGRRVLLLVLDGMSAAIAAELGEELREHWVEYDPVPRAKDYPQRRGMAAALPTVTSVSRTSLFAARVMAGTQADEKRLFPNHRFWGGETVAVFHKDDLRGESSGDTIGPELHDALVGDQAHVSVVLNTIDDRLAKEQKLGDGAWRLGEIGRLRQLLRLAAEQGRAVILVSDHGHVIDRHGVKIEASGVQSARHRSAGGAALQEAEIMLSGPRVVAPESGDEIVALWDADSRYTTQKAGYHGGAALAEFTIPVLAFLPFGAEPPHGWRELGSQQPPWWSLTPRPAEPVRSAVSGGVAPKKASKRAKADAVFARSDESLFDVVLTAAAEVPRADSAMVSVELRLPDDALVTALFASELFDTQVKVLGRKPNLAQVEKAVRALLEAGGTLPVTALAQRAGVRASGADGFGAVLRQLLNYDSAQVLENLPDGRTLRLDRELLREQFELG